jgi:hypothetical protein
VNNGNWLVASAETVAPNSPVSLDMNAYNYDNGTWVWSRPNGYFFFPLTSRTINSIPLISGLHTFEAVYVESNNCAYTQSFVIAAKAAASPGPVLAAPTLAVTQGSRKSNTAIVSSIYNFSSAVPPSTVRFPEE